MKQRIRCVVQPGAERVVGAEEPRSLRRQCRAAAALTAGGGVQQGKAQRLLRVLDDRPRLGVGHVHAQRRSAQRMKLFHLVQQLGNARPEAFFVGEQAHGNVVS